MNNLLVIRFSAFGDVILTIPVIMSALEQNPSVSVVLLTNQKFARYFPHHPRLIIAGYSHNDFSGLRNIFWLARTVKRKYRISKVVDLHSVIRSHLLTFFLRLSGLKVYRLVKPRKARKEFLSGKNRNPLPGVRSVYRDAFLKAGIQFELHSPPYFPVAHSENNKDNHDIKHIGIAPFAQHATKAWSLNNFLSLIRLLEARVSARFYIFCSADEAELLTDFAGEHIVIVANERDLQDEISLIQKLDVMVSLDSANMHLADILGTRVVSIWGGTHPGMGFGPENQESDSIIETQLALPCRPCSVYGKGFCKLDETPFICLTSITPERVAETVMSFL